MFKEFFVYPLAPHILIHPQPFLNHLKITLEVILKQKSDHFIVQSFS